jgi:hypothetical protein
MRSISDSRKDLLRYACGDVNMAREALRALSRRGHSLEEIFILHSPAYPHKDRATALLQCTALEDALLAAILSRFVALSNNDHHDLFEGDNPLSTFFAKIKLGFALGLYGERTRADLHCIRDIRNAFAHAGGPISFQTPEVIDACSQLRARPEGPEWVENAEMQYCGATSQIGMDLLLVAKRFRDFRMP